MYKRGVGGRQDGGSLFLLQQPEKLIPTLNSHTRSAFTVQVPVAIPKPHSQVPEPAVTLERHHTHTHTHKKRCAQLEKANDFTGKDKYRSVANAYALHTKMCIQGLIISTFQEHRSSERTRDVHPQTRGQHAPTNHLFSSPVANTKSSGGL